MSDWHDCTIEIPPHDAEVEFRRGENVSWVGRWRDLPSEHNIIGLHWRFLPKQPKPAPDALEPAVVFCVGGQAFNIQVPTDNAQFCTWIKVVRSDGMLLLPDAAIPWHAVVSVLRGNALASLYRSIGDAHLTQQIRPGEKPN